MLETSDLLKVLPHRIPALYLDRVCEVSEKIAVGYKNVTATEPQFRGHFVDNPIMPGVLTTEALVQMVWVLYRCQGMQNTTLSENYAPCNVTVELIDIKRIRFRQMVRPGDRIDLRVEETATDGDKRTISAVAEVDGKIACDAIMIFSVTAE